LKFLGTRKRIFWKNNLICQKFTHSIWFIWFSPILWGNDWVVLSGIVLEIYRNDWFINSCKCIHLVDWTL